jgi:hypothetical protein
MTMKIGDGIEPGDIRLTKRMAGSLKKTSRIVLAYMCDWPCAVHGKQALVGCRCAEPAISARQDRCNQAAATIANPASTMRWETRRHKVASASSAEMATSSVSRAADDNVDR